MTVSGSTLKNTYTLDESTTEFSYTFKIVQSSDMLATLYNSTTNVSTTISSDDYTVVGAGLDSGTRTVTWADAANYDSTYQLILQSNADFTQPTDYIEGDDFAEETHELALDRIVILTKQLKEITDRSLKVGVAQTTDIVFPAGQAGYFYTDGTNGSISTPTTTTTDYNGTFTHGADASKPSTPSIGDLYFATDTDIIYKCITSATWTYHGVFNNLSAAGTLGVTGLATLASLVFGSGATVTTILDEDAMGSDSATALATQQSIKAYADGLATGAVIKIGTFTRDVTTATGTANVTGLGITPKAVFVMANKDATAGQASWGLSDGTLNYCIANNDNASANTVANQSNLCIFSNQGGGNKTEATIGAFASGQFTVSYTKTGSPTGTLTCFYIAIG